MKNKKIHISIFCMDDLISKVCGFCKIEKTIINFGILTKSKDGFNAYCKECLKNKRKEKKEEIKKYHQNWYIKNKDYVKEQVKLYRIDNINYYNNQVLYKMKNHLKILIKGLEHADKRNKRDFNITLEYVMELCKQQNYKNLYTNTIIDWGSDHRKSSIDRIDSSKGHIIGNCQIVELCINRLKCDFTNDKFELLLNCIKNPPQNKFKELIFNNLSRKEKITIYNLVNNCKSRDSSTKINIQFIIDLYNKQKGKCSISNIPLILISRNINTLSLDRINNNQKYNLDNVTLVIWPINNMKNLMTTQETINILNTL